MEPVVEQTSFAAHQMRVEVVGLEAVHDGGRLAHRAVGEVHDRHARGVVLVGGEDFAGRLGAHGGDSLHFAAHHEQKGVEGVAPGREQGTAAVFFLCVPAELPIPRADAVVVVHLPVVQVAEQPLVDHRLGGKELRGKSGVETDAAPHARLRGGRHDVGDLGGRIGHRLLEDEVFPGLGRRDGVVAVLARQPGDVDDVHPRVGEHGVQVAVHTDRRAVFCRQFRGVERPRRADRGDAALPGGVDRGDVGGRGPAVTDETDVVV